MKKLMIAAAIVCAAAISQAATANWATPMTFTATDPTQGTYPITYTYAILEAASADAFTGVSFDNGILALPEEGVTQVGTIASITTTDYSTGGEWGGGVYGTLTGTAGNYYALVIHDAEYKMWGISDAVLAATDPGAIGEPSLKDVVFSNMTDDPWAWGSGKTMVANIADVPEPTTGLLMLLGMAGLALKRKRA